jgi:flagellar FliJ protein
MPKPFSLQAVLELMQTRADDATLHLAQLIAAEQDAQSKLQMLIQYRDEYALRFQQAAQNGLPPLDWNNYRQFLNRLDEAIAQQERTVLVQASNTATGQKQWQQQRTKLKAFDTLALRHQSTEMAREQRGDQKMQDEFAARRVDIEEIL